MATRREALRVLTEGDRAAAVVRSNIQAHLRFGGARDGVLVFDDDYMYLESPDDVLSELRPLFDLAWDDLGSDDADGQAPDGFAVGLAMAELITGVEITAEHGAVIDGLEFFWAPSLVYRR